MLISLPSRSVISLSGKDVKPFLNGICTIDTLSLSPEKPRYGLLLTPQGKLLHELFFIDRGEVVWLEVATERKPALLSLLKLYKLRADVVISETALQASTSLLPNPPLLSAEAVCIPDPRLAALGFRLYSPAPLTAEDEGAYHAHRIRLGVPEIGSGLVVEESLPLQFGLQHLNGVDFEKGCYTGQEVTARSKFRATLRRMLHQVKSVKGDALPNTTTPIMHAGKAVGELRASAGDMGLALLETEHAGAELQINESAVKAYLPGWMQDV